MIGEHPSSAADAGEAGELDRARAGDVAAFGALVRRHQEQVFRFLHRMLDAREEAKELTQDVFVKAWQALPGWRPEAAFSTWLLQIARNAALDQLRRRQVVRVAVVGVGAAVDDEARALLGCQAAQVGQAAFGHDDLHVVLGVIDV